MRVRRVVSSAVVAMLATAAALVGLAPASHADAATDLAAKFQQYGNTSSAWSGGDATNSVQLPDGRVLWFFADTFYGDVRSGGVRGPFDATMIRNSMVLQNGSTMSTVMGGTDAAPRSLTMPSGVSSDGDDWLWPADQMVSGGYVYKFFQHTVKTNEAPPFNFLSKGVELVKMPIASITNPSTYTKVTVPPAAQDCNNSTADRTCLLWGTDLLTVGAYTYIYGTEVVSGLEKYLHVARVPAGNLSATWEYMTATGWRADGATSSKRLMNGVQEGFSVSYIGGRYVLLTQAIDGLLAGDAVVYYSASPEGFDGSSRSRLYSTPETTTQTSRWTYEYRIVEHLSSGNQIVMSYNTNSRNIDGACANEGYWTASIYRPRFKTLTLPGTPTGGSDVAPTTPEPGSPWSLTAPAHCTSSTTAVPVPRSPALAASSGARLTMTWTQPTDPGAWNYDMQYRDVTAGQGWETPGAQGNTRTGYFFAPSPNRWDLSGLTPGHVYETRVRAGSWAGRQSAWVTSPRATAYLATPTAVTATRASSSSCRVTWTDTQPAVMWEVQERNTRTGATRVMGPIAVKDTTITFLTSDTYDYKVRSVNSTGASAWSAGDTC
ncbi:DUF5005 domain-containing protein [Luteipulveratus flavus]|uniref:DUF5005 domain-containing protein n=1 Tax=Luteipulveratus flavus TaxID=3031728 RepID=A0ABT6C225_9MICO|nr:DUF5005 domain-containing protein [Luteipulveratus sp. YIM 133296]MDF8262705.1 DUF5005 domain-containing protein [Luteipulveratus sp. YIM 133296]